jgi:hypothetical protein
MTLDLLGLEFDDRGYASTQVDFDGQQVDVDVIFDHGVRRALLEGLASRIDVQRLDFDARQSLRENLACGDADDAMPLYRSFHISELEPSLAGQFFDVEASPATDETFLRSMKLVGVGIYPESETIVCDYTIGREVTNYMVAVTFASSGKATVSLES